MQLTISIIIDKYAFDGFEERVGIDIQVVEDGLQIDILLFRLGIVPVLGQNHQIALIPPHNADIPLQTVWRPETAQQRKRTSTSKPKS